MVESGAIDIAIRLAAREGFAHTGVSHAVLITEGTPFYFPGDTPRWLVYFNLLREGRAAVQAGARSPTLHAGFPLSAKLESVIKGHLQKWAESLVISMERY